MDFTPSMLALRDLINNAEMLDLPLQGRTFTWQNSYSRSRIDRCLVSASSIDAWWKHEEFKRFGKESWNDICLTSSNLIQRLKELRLRIKTWNSEVFGDQAKHIKELSKKILMKHIAGMQVLYMKRRSRSCLVSERSCEQLRSGSNLFEFRNQDKNGILHVIEIQSFSTAWLQFTIETILFLRSNLKISFIQSLRISYFILESSIRVYIVEGTASGLILQVCDVAVCYRQRVIRRSRHSQRWKFLLLSVIVGRRKLQCLMGLSFGINTSFMVLVPKVAGSANIKDYRPIGLVNGFFKLLSKTLSRTLAPLMSKVVSENQHAFLKASRNKVKLLVLKLDFQKAFDSIDWSYLLSVMSWGVRQRDPISLCLFVIAVEGLKRLLDRSMELGLTHRFSYADNQDPISILQFMDDTILYVPYDIDYLKNLTRIVRCFELISGLTINFHKRSIMGIYTSEMHLLIAGEVVGCRIDAFAISRLFLIKSVLFSVPVYFMSNFSMPRAIQSQLESYLMRFLWKGDVYSRVISKISLRVVCQDFKSGGLVILSCSNGVDWDFLNNEDIKKLSFIWKNIRRTCCIEQRVWSIFVTNINIKVGKGDSISLWHDSWTNDGLDVLFPQIFQLSNQKHASINVIWNEGWRWRRHLRGSKLLLFINLQAAFNVLVPRLERLDEVIWNDKTGIYSPSALCKLFSTNNRATVPMDHHHNGEVRTTSTAARREVNQQLGSVMGEQIEMLKGRQ
ncbi:uncharacterized protein LOC126661641 [Mercurialis annua]|uniref:uncharacterized protein LOC126661641 n=1 Tax=Mercurialis annua TaxID=3986 RepID=UPI00216044CB|nr:uncharacterized protein LOC126661641 [Mercurialis annua]